MTPEATQEGSPPATYPDPPEKVRRSRELSRLSVHGWIAGVAGAITVLVMGYLGSSREVLTKGWALFGGQGNPALATAFPLLVIAAVMFVIEIGIRLKVDRGSILVMPEDLRSGGMGRFLRECVAIYAVEVGLLSLALGVFQFTNEYGFQRNAEYYRPWFSVMRIFFWIYVYGGLPYVMLTRAFQHDPRADKRQAAFTVIKAGRRLLHRLDARFEAPEPFAAGDRTAVLGLFVKLFFVPLMTVFFADQFSHLIKNVAYVKDLIFPSPGHSPSFGIRDFYNVSFTVIFSIDVGLAWAGYVVSSRWIKNGMYSVEPTVLGWVVALLSYPPFNRVFGFYFSTPGENGFLSISSHPAVVFLASCSVLSFLGYMSATVCFGLRFSNLTHRGIITTGPYAVVRHPAYAAKNFSWWCVMLPYALYDAWTKQSTGPLLLVLGLVVMSSIYYMRAITEERHLGLDAEYRAYAKKVPYRFIPGVI
jgi:protein-S-isoprenylcysteine O-methyltransferase Ste14